MQNRLYLFFIAGLFALLTSCSNQPYQYLFQQPATQVTGADTASGANYRIKPQDLLQMRNLQNISYLVSDAQTNATTANGATVTPQTFQVEDDGTVALPALGHLKVAGLTRAQAAKQIEELYRKNLLKDPIIELKIVNLKVTMLGEIRSQGNYTLTKDRTSLVEMIGEAGGLTEKANETNIKIIRGDEGHQQITEINLRDTRAINDPRTILQSGDVIYIAQNKRANRSDNLQNFSSIMQPALLLFNTALIIFTLSHR